MSRRNLDNDAFRMGALTVTRLGYVGTSPKMHNSNYIFPDQYRAFRIYWSTVTPGQVRNECWTSSSSVLCIV